MTWVTVYQFTVYVGSEDENIKSRRWATREAIERIKVGVILEDTATEVDSSVLDGNGMTERNFDPQSLLRGGGFQTRVIP